MPSEKKRGAISAEEEKYLKENYKNLSPAEIAEELNRNEETVRGWFKTVLGVSPDDPYLLDEGAEIEAIKKKLIRSPEWGMLKKEFDEDELNVFKRRYARYAVQLEKEGILATEESQIFLLVKYEILQHRALAEMKSADAEVLRVQELIEDLLGSFPDVGSMDPDSKNMLTTMKNEVNSIRIAKQSKGKEYNEYVEKHSRILRDMKSTRDQRINRIENSAGSVLELFKNLALEDVQRHKGRHMELMAKAVEKQRKDFSQYHKFVDGEIDKPLLTPENVMED